MIHLLNRSELFITFDLNRLNEMRGVLSAAGIDYQYRTKDLSAPTFGGRSRARTGTFGMRDDARIEYKVYVKRVDLDRAKALL